MIVEMRDGTCVPSGGCVGRMKALVGCCLVAARVTALRSVVHRTSAVRLQIGGDFTIRDTRSFPARQEQALAEEMAQVVNWAYRGKHPERDESAWTGERHLLTGIRTTAPDVLAMLRAARDQGPIARAILVAGQPSNDNRCIGTVQVESSSGEGGSVEADIGLFSVDPDLQGQGLGKALLRAAEEHAAQRMGASCAVLWVITSRDELIGWYLRLGYVRTERTAPFPTDANVGVPVSGAELEFVRLEKQL